MKRLTRTLTVACLLAAVASPVWAAGFNDVVNALESPFRDHRIRDYTADFFQESRIASLDRMQRARGGVKVLFDSRGQEAGRGPDSRVATVMFHWQYEEPTRQELVSDGRTMWVYLPENNQVIQSDIGQVSMARENDPMTFLTGLGNLSRDFQINFATPNRDAEGNYILELRPRRTTTLINRMVIVVDRYAVDKDAAAPFSKSSPSEPSVSSRSRDSRNSSSEGGSGSPSRSGSFFDDNFDAKQFMKENAPVAGAPRSEPPPTESSSFASFHRSSQSGEFPILSTMVYDPNGNSTLIEFSNIRVNVGLSPAAFRFMLPAGVEVVRPTGKEMGF